LLITEFIQSLIQILLASIYYYRKTNDFFGSGLEKVIGKIKNLTEIQELIESIGVRTSLPQDQVMFALELALEQSVCEYFNLSDCQIDIEGKTITKSSFERKVIDLKEDGDASICPGFTFEMLHKHIVHRCRKLFDQNLAQMETAYLYEKWKGKLHQAAEGVIHKIDSDKVLIHLGDKVRGIMTKPEWVPKEIPLYQTGRVLWFYVSKVLQDQSAVTVYLSRGSKNLPTVLLKTKLPWVKITAIKRYRGIKTYLKTNAVIDSNLIKEVQQELKGEVIDVQVI